MKKKIKDTVDEVNKKNDVALNQEKPEEVPREETTRKIMKEPLNTSFDPRVPYTSRLKGANVESDFSKLITILKVCMLTFLSLMLSCKYFLREAFKGNY